MKFKRYPKTGLLVKVLLLSLYATAIYADATSGSGTVGDLATNIQSTFASLAKLITGVSYVAGMGFAMASILKFKAHRDNPQQIPIGTPIALLFVAAALLFLPSLFTIAGKTVFGTSASSAGISGTTGGT